MAKIESRQCQKYQGVNGNVSPQPRLYPAYPFPKIANSGLKLTVPETATGKILPVPKLFTPLLKIQRLGGIFKYPAKNKIP